MKAIKLLAFSLIALSFAGCDDELFDIKFGLNTQDVTFTIKPSTTAGVMAIDTTLQKLNLDSLALANGADVSKLKSAKPKKITFKIISPLTANFDILESGFITIGAPGLPTIRIAEFTKVNIPLGATQFEIIPMDVDILPYAKSPTISTSGQLVTNGPVMEAITLNIASSFEVVANPVAK